MSGSKTDSKDLIPNENFHFQKAISIFRHLQKIQFSEKIPQNVSQLFRSRKTKNAASIYLAAFYVIFMVALGDDISNYLAEDLKLLKAFQLANSGK